MASRSGDPAPHRLGAGVSDSWPGWRERGAGAGGGGHREHGVKGCEVLGQVGRGEGRLAGEYGSHPLRDGRTKQWPARISRECISGI